MGCGTSKFDPEQSGPTCKFEPLLRSRRVEETSRQQRSERVILVSNLSFKHLLIGDDENGQSPDNHGLIKSVSSPMEIDGGNGKSPDNQGRKSISSPIEIRGGNEKFLDNHGRKSLSSPMEADGFVKEGEFKQEDNRMVERVFGDEKDQRNEERETDREREEEGVKDNNEFGEEDGKTDEGEGGYTEREDSLIAAPGSPSFRDYCLINGHTSKDDAGGDGGRVQNNPRRENSIAHMTSRQESAPQVGKNGRNGKGRKIGHALSMGGPKSVKNLWNVSPCYNPNYSSSHDSPRKTA